LVMNHYVKLGFKLVETYANGGHRAILDLGDFVPIKSFIRVTEGTSE
jgi:hypothetical protein